MELLDRLFMATIDPRVNIALDRDTLSTLKEIAHNTKKSVSAICAEFVKRQLEFDEDAYDLKLIKSLGNIDEIEAISSEEARKLLDALPG